MLTFVIVAEKISSQDKTPGENIKNVNISTWHFEFGIEQLQSFSNKNDPYTDFSFSTTKKISKNSKIRFLQSLTKLYKIDPGGNELLVHDTRLYHFYKFEKKPLDLDYSWRTSATIPLSQESQNKEYISTITGRISVTKKIMDGEITIQYRPTTSYYLKRYKQTLSGTNLNKYRYGHSILFNYAPKDFVWEIEAIFSSHVTIKESSKYQATKVSDNPEYSINVNFNYQLIPNSLSFTLGYVQADSQINEGRVEVSLYDEEISSVYAGLNIEF